VSEPGPFRRRGPREYFPMSRVGMMFFIGCFLVMGFGCGNEAPKPKKVPISPAPKRAVAPAPAKVAPKAEAEVKVEPPPLVSYSYNPQGKRNPFRPLVVERPEKPATPAAKRMEAAGRKAREVPATPLERLDLAELKLVALVWDIPKPRAMVEDKGGKGYILGVGTRIGKNQGQVSKITPEGVVVREKTEAPDGKIRTREVPLRLYADQ
jgi:type IV pilus assembly protein PilP